MNKEFLEKFADDVIECVYSASETSIDRQRLRELITNTLASQEPKAENTIVNAYVCEDCGGIAVSKKGKTCDC